MAPGAVALLDVNVLLALAWPNHVYHEPAHRWFASTRARGWATCPYTEAAFVRLSMEPAVVKSTVSFRDALAALASSMAAPEHVFWPLDYAITDVRTELRERIASHLQLGDALLLDLAIRKQGRLATLDRRIEKLLPEESPLRGALVVIPTETAR